MNPDLGTGQTASDIILRHIRNKGATVAALTEPEIARIFETRTILESNAIRFVLPHMTPATFDQAQAFCDEFNGETDAARWSALNWKFHSCLYGDAQRSFGVDTIRPLNDRRYRYLRVQLTLLGRASDRQHRTSQDFGRLHFGRCI